MADTYVDDMDSRIQYAPAGNWAQSGGPQEYGKSTHFTDVDGSTATLTFTGTGIGVYGTIATSDIAANGGAPTVLFSVDGSNAVQFTPVSTNQTRYRQQFFSSQGLSNGQHTIVITKYHHSSAFFLDYFIITSPLASPNSNTDSNPTNTTPNPTPTNTTPPPSSPSGSNNGGGVATSPTKSSADSSKTTAFTSLIHSTTSNASFVFSTSTGQTDISTTITASPSSSVDNTSGSTHIIGGIVGGALGCIVLLLSVTLFLLARRYLRHKYEVLNVPKVTPLTISTGPTSLQRVTSFYSSTTGEPISPRTTVQRQTLRKFPLGPGADTHFQTMEDAPPRYQE